MPAVLEAWHRISVCARPCGATGLSVAVLVRVLNVTVYEGTSEWKPTNEYELYCGMYLEDWKRTEDGTREGNRWPGDRRVHRAGPVEAAVERFMQGKFGLLPKRKESVYMQALAMADEEHRRFMQGRSPVESEFDSVSEEESEGEGESEEESEDESEEQTEGDN